MGTGYFYYTFFSFFGLPLAFNVDNKPYFFAVLTTQLFLPIGACLLTLFLILSNSLLSWWGINIIKVACPHYFHKSSLSPLLLKVACPHYSHYFCPHYFPHYFREAIAQIEHCREEDNGDRLL